MTADDTRPPTGPTTPLRRRELAWFTLVLVTSSVLVVYTSRSIGPTFDEPFYIAKGLDHWHTGSPKALMRAGTMPLPVDAQTLPLHLWERHRGERFNAVEKMNLLLPVARAMNLPFWWLLLASAFRLARRWGGPSAAGVAVGLLAFEPNLLAHAALATTDIAVTAGVLAATNALLRGREGGWWRRVFVPGAWAGLAVLCKASAVTFVPLVFAALLWWRGEARRIVRDGFGIGVVAAVLVFGYVGSDWAVEPSFVKWANTLPEGEPGDAVRTVAARLRIFPNAAEGVIQQVKHNVRGHGVYTLGEYHPRAVWYYFPVVLSQKLTEPVLLLLLGCLAFRPRSLVSPAGFVAILLLIFSLTCRVQIGVRLVFPLVAFLILAVSIAVCGRRPHPPAPSPSRRPGVQGGSDSGRAAPVTGRVILNPPRHWGGSPGEVTSLLGWLAVLASAILALLTAPHGLRYQNQFWGGAARAGDNLTDSNFDWGQGVPELRDWWRANGEPRLTVWYYGTDWNAFRPPFHPVQLHVSKDRGVEFVKRTSAGGYFAVGRTFLTACPGTYRQPDMLATLAWLNAQPPVAEVGGFAVYKFE